MSDLERTRRGDADNGVRSAGDALARSIDRLRRYVDVGSIAHVASSYRTSDGVVHVIDFDDLRAVLDAADHSRDGGGAVTGQEARDEERETLVRLLARQLGWDWALSDDEPIPESAGMLFEFADVILVAGYRKHPEPEITEAMVERGARAFWTAIDDNPIIDAEDYPAMRRALEAALREPLGEGEDL